MDLTTLFAAIGLTAISLYLSAKLSQLKRTYDRLRKLHDEIKKTDDEHIKFLTERTAFWRDHVFKLIMRNIEQQRQATTHQAQERQNDPLDEFIADFTRQHKKPKLFD